LLGYFFAADPVQARNVLVGSPGGAYYSVNAGAAGAAWSLSSGILGLQVRDLGVSPLEPSKVWLATFGSGTWTRASSAAPWALVTEIPYVDDFSVAPDPNVAGRVFVGGYHDLYESSDGGAFVYDGVDSNVFAMAFDPSNPNTLYAATQISGVLKSVNGGTTWSASNGALTPWTTSAGDFIDVRSVVVDLDTPRTVYIGTNGEGVYQSLDGGGSWQNVLAPTGTITCLLLTPGPSETLYACVSGMGIEQSVNGGTVWTDASEGLPTLDVAGLVFDVPSGNLYAASAQGVFVSQGAGPWSSFDVSCLPGMGAAAPVIVTNGQQRQLLVGANGGVYSHAI
jgi:hypothetical protein